MKTLAKIPRSSSVERTGPAGYEYQYLVTTWLILLLWESGLQAGFVEGGREDTTLDLQTPEGPYRLEVQIKSQKGGVTVERLASWLTHFPSRSASNPLLEWLQESNQRGIVFVTSGRVEGSLTGLLSGLGASDLLKSRKQPAISLSQAKRLRDALGNCHKRPSPTNLERQRRQYCAGLPKKLRLDELRQLSRRVFIWEQMSPEAVAKETSHLLNMRFRVPQSQVSNVREELVAFIPQAREDGLDLIPIFRKVLQGYLQSRILSEQINVSRGYESELVASLRDESVLLLTGPMLCGKTHTGRSVAQRFQDEGFALLETDDPERAKRFLLDFSIPEDRLVLLEDPFGKVTPKGDAFEQWQFVNDLASGLRPHRKLIVSCRRDILQILNTESNPTLAGRRWRDLVLSDPALAVEMWHAHASGQNPEVLESVADGLARMDPEHLLQPGQIRFLARSPSDSLKSLEFKRLLEIARFQAREIGRRLIYQRPMMQQVLAALTLSATTLVRVSIEEVNFILSDSEILPGRIDLELVRTYGGPDQPVPSFPEYPRLVGLVPEHEAALDEIESLGLIEQAGAGYRFSHPIYEQAGLEALWNLPKFQFEGIIRLIRRAMYSLSSATAKVAVDTLHRLRREEDNAERLEVLTKLSFEAFLSIFPVARDISMKRLAEDFEVLGPDAQNRLLRIVRSEWREREDILWHCGEPWFDTRETIPVSELFSRSVSAEAAAEAQEALRSLIPDGRLAAEHMWTLLKSFVQSQELSDLVILERALNYDETLIRGEAAFLLFRDHCSGPPDLFDRIVKDPDPAVMAEAVRGLVKGWESHDESARASALEVLMPALAHPSRAVLAVQFLTQFEEMTGRYEGDAPWELWAEIASPVLQSVPRHYDLNEGSLYRMFTMAIPTLDRSKALKVLNRWIEWIETSLSERLPDDYGLGVAELLLRITGNDAGARRQFMSRLFAQTDTSFRVTLISDLVNGWKDLDKAEREEIFAFLREPRVDRRWVQAASLTVRQPPQEIIESLLGDGTVFLLPEEALLERFPGGLLEACLSMHTGHPQPLWWIGLHHRAAEPWNRLLRRIARDPHNSLFDLAIREVLLELSRGGDSAELMEIWQDLTRECGVDLCMRLFEHLLRWTARMTGAALLEPWKLLFQAHQDDRLHQIWFERTFDALGDIERSGNLDLFVGIPGFVDALLEKFPEDGVVLRLARKLPDPVVREVIMGMYELSPPKLLRTHDVVLAALGGGRDSIDPLVQKVFEVRGMLFDQWDSSRGRWSDHFKLSDWVSNLDKI